MKLRLTGRGHAELKRRGRLTVQLRLEVRAGGKVLQRQTRRVTFRMRR